MKTQITDKMKRPLFFQRQKSEKLPEHTQKKEQAFYGKKDDGLIVKIIYSPEETA
jgi:hypothetical protein